MSWPSKITFLITGASSGFGLALCRIALANGHSVIAVSRSSTVQDEIESKGGQWHALDLMDPNCASLIDTLESAGTHIDVLVNSAGRAILGPAESFNEEQVREQMELSFFGPYRLIRAVTPYMRSRRRGMVVNLSSGAGVDGREGMALYGGSKSALDGPMRVMVKELAVFDIRALTVHLGAFDTPFSTKTTATSSTALPDDYKGTMVDKVVSSVSSKDFNPDGDHVKASQAIYDIVMGQGVGQGLEGERIIALGKDMQPMMDRVLAATKHSMEVFHDVRHNVSRN